MDKGHGNTKPLSPAEKEREEAETRRLVEGRARDQRIAALVARLEASKLDDHLYHEPGWISPWLPSPAPGGVAPSGAPGTPTPP